MLPDFLKKFSAEIAAYKLETIQMEAKPLKELQPLPLKQSKFLGKPFLPLHHPYPMDKHGTPMILWAQINFAETPVLSGYPTTGIFQLFVSATNWEDMSDYQILFHQHPNQEAQTDFSFLTKELYEESPIYCEHELTFTKKVEYGGTEDFRFQLKFDGLNYYDFQETLTRHQQNEMDKLFAATGHKIGGYAFFTQSDPRDYQEEKRADVLVLQIDTDEQIMFGDGGVMNVFLNAIDLKNGAFSNAWFNWDCS